MSERTFLMIDLSIVIPFVILCGWRIGRFIRRLGRAVDIILKRGTDD